MKQPYLTFLFLVIFLIACTCNNEEKSVLEITEDYYEVYKSRSDFQKFLSFYDENIELEDMVFGVKIEGKEELEKFFNWNDSNFVLLEEKALIVEEQIIENVQVVTSGYFSKFKWGELEVGPMHFTTILTFNEKGKIIKHVDWINYPNSLINNETRSNSKDWILK